MHFGRRAPLAALPLLAGALVAPGCGPSPADPGDGPDDPAESVDAAAPPDGSPPGADAGASTCGETPPGDHAVRVVYLIPSDRGLDQGRADALWSALLHLRRWFAEHSGGGETFRIPERVELAELPREEAWFSSHDSGGGESGWFVDNVIAEGRAATGAAPGDSTQRWVFVIDAIPGCGQTGRGMSDGVAVFHGNDLRALVGEPTIAPCSGEPSGGSRCATVGFLGFMLGAHAGLHYPDGCSDDSAGTPCLDTWLFNGAFESYPEATLSPDNQERLSASPFFEPIELSGCPTACNAP